MTQDRRTFGEAFVDILFNCYSFDNLVPAQPAFFVFPLSVGNEAIFLTPVQARTQGACMIPEFGCDSMPGFEELPFLFRFYPEFVYDAKQLHISRNCQLQQYIEICLRRPFTLLLGKVFLAFLPHSWF